MSIKGPDRPAPSGLVKKANSGPRMPLQKKPIDQTNIPQQPQTQPQPQPQAQTQTQTQPTSTDSFGLPR